MALAAPYGNGSTSAVITQLGSITPTGQQTIDGPQASCLSAQSVWAAANVSWFDVPGHARSYNKSTSIVTMASRGKSDASYPDALATCNGVPYASGWVTTSTITVVETVSTMPFPTPAPDCTLDNSQCLAWWTTSFKCAALEGGVTEPPQYCSTYANYTPCASPTALSIPFTPVPDLPFCYLMAATAQLFYWPSTVVGGSFCNQTMTSGPANTTRTAVVGSVTVTSPSVALSVPWMYAANMNYDRFGRYLEDIVVPLAPHEVTSLQAGPGPPIYDDKSPRERLDFGVLSPGLPSWDAWIGCRACAQTYGAVTTGAYASLLKEDKFCGTVWVDVYEPELYIPPQFTSLQPEWVSRSCAGLFAFLDPPKTLSEQTAAAGPTAPVNSITTTSAQPASTSQTAPRTSSAPSTPTSAVATSLSQVSETSAAESSTNEAVSSASAQTSSQASDGPPASISDPVADTTSESLDPGETSASSQVVGQSSAGVPSSYAETSTLDPPVTSQPPSATTNEGPSSLPGTNESSDPTSEASTAEVSNSADSSDDPTSVKSTTASPTDALGVLTQAVSTAQSTTNIGGYIASILGISSSTDGSLGSSADPSAFASSAADDPSLSNGPSASAAPPAIQAGSALETLASPGTIITQSVPSSGALPSSAINDAETFTTQDVSPSAISNDPTANVAYITQPDGQTLTVGAQGAATVVYAGSAAISLTEGAQYTVQGNTISLPSTADGILVNGGSVAFSNEPTASPVASTVNGAVITGTNGGILTVLQTGSFAVVAGGSTTLTLSPGAQSTLEGIMLSQAASSDEVLINGTPATLSELAADPTLASAILITAEEQTLTIARKTGSDYVVAAGSSLATLSPGVQTTFNGVTLSMATSGGDVLINGTPATIGGALTASSTDSGIVLTRNGQTLTAARQSDGNYLVADSSTTLTLGPGTDHSLNGVTLSQPSTGSGLIIDGTLATISRLSTTSAASGSDPTGVLTAGGETLTALRQSNNEYIIAADATTFTVSPGGSPIVVGSATLSEGTDGVLTTLGTEPIIPRTSERSSPGSATSGAASQPTATNSSAGINIVNNGRKWKRIIGAVGFLTILMITVL
ncbi:hypothetical protein LTR97_000340 [Elasticomyces elasticus]|uniref:Uncharacterized protein n=1 Tax=Elasticomyces elasticus TaxID=574655 RepID=A0AAN7WEA6_9PEZI|nr:hypothetical protein LTR97_000340 [Elasticomyces elasticus]